MDDEVVYVCPTCREEVTLSIDVSAGNRQEYIEDCPVCCRPNVIRLRLGADGPVIDVRSE